LISPNFPPHDEGFLNTLTHFFFAMKPFLTLLACLFSFHFLSAQDGPARGDIQGEVPDVVKNVFIRDFPEARDFSWRKLNRQYLVDFRINSIEAKATYSGTGIWLQTDYDLPLEKFPQRALDHHRENYGSFPIVGAAYHDEEDNRYYLLKIQIRGEVKYLKYDDEGGFLP